MALTVTANAAAGSASIAFPAHAIGDRLVVVAWRDGNNAVPTKPAAAGTVPAFLDIDAPTGSNTCSMRSATFVATATNHTTGAWTNATGIAAIVVSGGACAIGFHAMAGAADTNQALAPDLPDQWDLTGNSRIVSIIGHRNVTAWGTPPAGYTALASVATELIVLSDTDTTSAGAITQPCTAPTLGGYRGTQIEFVPLTPLSSLTDTFATLDTAKWTASSGAVTVSGNQLRIALTAGFDALVSNALYNLAGSSLVIEFAQAPNVSAGNTATTVYLESSLDANDTIELAWQGSGGAPGVFTSRQSLDATPNDLDVAYSSTNHRWWQLSESGGTLTWATSPTGLAGTWTTQRTLPVGAMDITGVRVGIGASSGGDASPGTAIFDNINSAPVAAPSTGAWFSFMRPQSSVTPASGGGGEVSGEFFTWSGTNPNGRLAFSHNYGIFPRSIENDPPASDYYNVFINPAGDSYWTPFGGWIRDRPLPRAPLSGDYQLQDAREDVEQMIAGGMDGMFCNIMSTTVIGDEWYLLFDKWIAAANTYHPGFLVVPEIDISAGFTSANIPALADLLVASYYGKSSTWMIGGTFIVAVFQMEGVPLSFYTGLQSALATRGVSSTKFVGVFVDYSAPATYTSVMYGSGAWGFGADPAVAASTETGKTAAVARGEQHIAPIWLQDIRPREDTETAGTPTCSSWTEALNTGSLRAHWDKAITEGSKYVCLATHQDLTEGSQFCKTAMTGGNGYLVSSYLVAKWKGGADPTITQDVMVLSYRNHLNGAGTSGPETLPPLQWYAGAGGSTKRYHIEALVFLTAAATVRIKGTDFSAPMGMSVWSIPATSGAVTASIIRSAVTVVSLAPPVTIRSGNVWQSTFGYYYFSNLRDPALQWDFTYTTAGAPSTYPSAPASDLTVANNGDGTATITGTGVINNGDGTTTITSTYATNNGDGTATLVGA